MLKSFLVHPLYHYESRHGYRLLDRNITALGVMADPLYVARRVKSPRIHPPTSFFRSHQYLVAQSYLEL